HEVFKDRTSALFLEKQRPNVVAGSFVVPHMAAVAQRERARSPAPDAADTTKANELQTTPSTATTGVFRRTGNKRVDSHALCAHRDSGRAAADRGRRWDAVPVEDLHGRLAVGESSAGGDHH
ncbi:hypothetical protein BHM03_00026456, partial [Ensete ventricosum]